MCQSGTGKKWISVLVCKWSVFQNMVTYLCACVAQNIVECHAVSLYDTQPCCMFPFNTVPCTYIVSLVNIIEPLKRC